MAATECGHGHIYDPDIYASCPYCNSAQPVINFGSAPVGGPGPTQGFGTPAGGPRSTGFTGPWQGGGQTVMEGGKTAPIGGPLGGAGQSVTDSGVTKPPRGYQAKGEKRADEELKTVGEMQKRMGIDPVVGWLVCVEGKEKGKDFRLLGKINTIGRSEKMDVCLKGDPTISSVNHARLGYGEKNNRFTLIPAEGTNVIYLNGEEIYIPTPLSAYDVIDFGETKLVFIPMCSERFTWDKGISNEVDCHGAV